MPKSLIAGHAPSATRQTIAAMMQRPSARGDRRQAVEQRVAEAVAEVPRPRQAPSARDARPLPSRGSIPAAHRAAGRRHHFVTRRSHPVYPGPSGPTRDSIGGHAWTRQQQQPALPAIGVMTPPSAAEISRKVVFDIQDLTVYYGKAPAVKDVSLAIHENAITALIGPSGCGKSTVLRCLNRMNDLVAERKVDGKVLYHGIDLYGVGRRPDRGAPPHRHGLPAAEPVPEVDLRQRRLRAADPRHEGRPRRPRRARAQERGAVGRGEEPAQEVRARPLRRPAAAALHRARDRRRARRRAARRARLRARPDLDRRRSRT